MRCTLQKELINPVINLKYLLAFSIGMMLFGHTETISLIAITIITIALILNINRDDFLFSYFALIFFEAILTMPIVGGSFFRIYQVLFLFRVIIDFQRRFKYKTSLKLNIIAAFIFLFFSLFYSTSLEGFVSLGINILILSYIIVSFKLENRSQIINKIFVYVALFSTLSGIYGFLFVDAIEYGYVNRIVGTMGDPNYSALFYTLGIFAVIGNDLFSKRIKMAFLLCLLFLLISTISLSGILGTILFLMLYFWFIKPRKGLLVSFCVILIFIVFMNFNYEYGTSFYAIKYRIISIMQMTDLNLITSSRTSLASHYMSYFSSLPLASQLFGGHNTVSGIFRESMIMQFGNVSHLSYIDMLFMVGILGTVIIVGIFIIMIIKNIRIFHKTRNKAYLMIAFSKLIILYYGLSISIFPFRYFYTFFLI